MRAVVTMPIVAMVSTLRADVGRRLSLVGCRLCLHRASHAAFAAELPSRAAAPADIAIINLFRETLLPLTWGVLMIANVPCSGV